MAKEEASDFSLQALERGAQEERAEHSHGENTRRQPPRSEDMGETRKHRLRAVKSPPAALEIWGQIT